MLHGKVDKKVWEKTAFFREGYCLFSGRKIAAPCLSSLLEPSLCDLERRLLVRDRLFHPLYVSLHVDYLLQEFFTFSTNSCKTF